MGSSLWLLFPHPLPHKRAAVYWFYFSPADGLGSLGGEGEGGEGSGVAVGGDREEGTLISPRITGVRMVEGKADGVSNGRWSHE